MNVCPVYERAGGHAYGSTYPPHRRDPVPAASGIEAAHNNCCRTRSSSVAHATRSAPVKINLPRSSTHLRAKDVESKHAIRELEGNKSVLADGRHDARCEEAHLRQDDVHCRAWSAHVPPYQRPQAQDHRCSCVMSAADRLPRHPRAWAIPSATGGRSEKRPGPRDNAQR